MELILTLLCCVVEAQMVCVREGGTPLLIQEWRWCFNLCLARNTGLHRLSMVACHRHSNERQCNRTVQFIRAKVQYLSPKRSNYHTWAHINPVVRWNHERSQTNQHTNQDRTWFNITSHMLHHSSQMVHKYLIYIESHIVITNQVQIAEAK